MEILLAILLWLGIISSPKEATDELIKANRDAIEKTIKEAETDASIGPPIIHILEDQE